MSQCLYHWHRAPPPANTADDKGGPQMGARIVPPLTYMWDDHDYGDNDYSHQPPYFPLSFSRHAHRGLV